MRLELNVHEGRRLEFTGLRKVIFGGALVTACTAGEVFSTKAIASELCQQDIGSRY